MKNRITAVLLLLSLAVFGQGVPDGISYQAVAIDPNGIPVPGIDPTGVPIPGAEIYVRLSIIEASPQGSLLYEEEHMVLTDQYGMFTLTIGQGNQTGGSSTFPNIVWESDKKYLQTELDLKKNGNYTLTSVQQLMSVPYAFVARNVLNNDDADADPTNEIQTLSINGTTVSLSNNGGSITLPPDQVNDADADPINEIQTLSINGTTVSLSNNGGSITLPPDQVNDADADPTNEIQSISLNNGVVTLSNNGGSFILPPDADADSTNELQTISISGTTVSLSNNGGSITLPPDQVNDADADPTNEIQSISLNNGVVTLSNNGGSITLPPDTDADSTNEIQTLSINGTTVSLSNNGGSITLPPDQVNDADSDPNNELQVLSLNGDTIFLSQGGFITLPADLVNDNDSDSLNEIQTITINGALISISKGGGTIQLPIDRVNDQDSSIFNELQSLSFSNDTLYLSDGGSVYLGGYNSGSTSNPTNQTTFGFTNGNDTIVGPRSLGGNQTTWVIDSVYVPGGLVHDIDLKYNVSSLDRYEMRILNRQQFNQYLSGINPLAGLPLSEPTQSLNFYSEVFSTNTRGGGCCGVVYRDIELTNYRSNKVNYTHNDRGNNQSVITKVRHEQIHLENPTDRVYIFSKGSNTHIDYRAGISSNSTTSSNSLQLLDNDSTNEIQSLSISNDTLFLSKGGFVKLPGGSLSNHSSNGTQEILFVSNTLTSSLASSGSTIDTIVKIVLKANILYELEMELSASVQRYTCGATSSVIILDPNFNPVPYHSIKGNQISVNDCNNAVSNSSNNNLYFKPTNSGEYTLLFQYSVSGYNNYQNQGNNGGSAKILLREIGGSNSGSAQPTSSNLNSLIFTIDGF